MRAAKRDPLATFIQQIWRGLYTVRDYWTIWDVQEQFLYIWLTKMFVESMQTDVQYFVRPKSRDEIA